MGEFLSRELNLTPEQRVKIDTLVSEQVREIHAIWESSRPRVDSVVARTRSEMEKILTPDQRKKFEELRMRRERRGFFPPGPPPGEPRR